MGLSRLSINARLSVYEADGVPIDTWQLPESEFFFDPRSLTLDEADHLYVNVQLDEGLAINDVDAVLHLDPSGRVTAVNHGFAPSQQLVQQLQRA